MPKSPLSSPIAPRRRGLEIARQRGLNAVAIPSQGARSRSLRPHASGGTRQACRGSGVSRRFHAAAERLLHPTLSQPHSQHSSFAAAGVSGLGRAASSSRRTASRSPAARCILSTKNLDAGPIIIQAAVPVLDDDTVETLSARILEEEHRIYPAAIRLVVAGSYRIEGRRVVFC